MAKNCLIYETLNGVSKMSTSRNAEGLMTLSGVFGVCGVRNNNQRVYETSNYSKMVSEMKDRIKNDGGIPGELEHPQTMNVTLENVSHKITDINIDENGVVTGSITLLDTPKGKIAQAIVEGGLPLFISSRATGNVDKTGNVCLEKISTYDLVGTPGFSQARLKLNENQIVESINESTIYYIADKEENEEINENDNMELNELLEKFEALTAKVDKLEEANETLQEQLEEAQSNKFNEDKFVASIQNWLIEEFAPEVEKWVTEQFAPTLQNEIIESIEETIEETIEESVEETKKEINNSIVEQYIPCIQDWVTEQFAPEVEKWCCEHFAAGIQDWVVEQFAPEVENWMNESYMSKIQDSINESIKSTKKTDLDAIDETLKVLESIELTKPSYSRKAIVTENLDEPQFIREMPAEKRVQWEMASNEVKESIQRRAKLYNFINEGAIERFWESINFEEIKPVKNIYEGLEGVMDERERAIRAAFRRNRR